MQWLPLQSSKETEGPLLSWLHFQTVDAGTAMSIALMISRCPYGYDGQRAGGPRQISAINQVFLKDGLSAIKECAGDGNVEFGDLGVIGADEDPSDQWPRFQFLENKLNG